MTCRVTHIRPTRQTDQRRQVGTVATDRPGADSTCSTTRGKMMAKPGHPSTCSVVHAGELSRTGKQGFNYFTGVSAETVGAQGICMHLLTIPPGGWAKPHLHEAHETAIYVLGGTAGMWFGDGLKEHLEAKTGDFVYIPAGMPHLPYNLSQSEPCTAVVARTDPNEQESVRLLPKPKHLTTKAS